ncbi:hypothetical protein N752_18540 [Desulforamulus aquiferis]|nr:hypothetical protein N752_18540 [Desulforamulus aquiferis]
MYSILENQIIPAYYNKSDGYPREWIGIMKNCIKTITPQFSTERMVKEYTDRFYSQVANRGEQFSVNNFQVASQLQDYKRFIKENWHYVSVKSVDANIDKNIKVGETLDLAASVYLGPIPPEDVVVEVVHGCEGDHALTEIKTIPLDVHEKFSEGAYNYRGGFRLDQGTCGFTVRVRPENPYLATRFELPLASWANNF